ncbi:hypothetical protein [Ferrimonas balearica]|uniref:hypothetical protein n=1 Tax=Ferrimonas balearica TaxID=44012 RepID=UPI001C98414A|nr:hypothetical protein [Ferrimonas balearica]MBY5980497.1 hypothetical protein [Ferrimonas balearica]
MKASVAAVMMTALVTTGAAANNWSSAPRDDGQTQFNVELSGSVPQRCQMFSKQEKSIELDLANGGTEQFRFKAWCNTDGTKGLLVVGANALTNADGQSIIPMKVKLKGGEGSVIDRDNNASSSTNYHAIETSIEISNSTDSGKEGQYNVLNITPQLNGWERSGEYKTNMYVSLYPM